MFWQRCGSRLAVKAALREMGRNGTAVGAFQTNKNHNYPVVAKAPAEHQSHEFEFAPDERQLFEVKSSREARFLNDHIGEQDAEQQASTFADQLQSQEAHRKYSVILQLKAEIEVGDAELTHVPTRLAGYRFVDKNGVIVIGGNSGQPIHTGGNDD